MYEAFYRLNVDPFRLSPDYRFCFAHGSYAKAKAYLQYGLQRGEGLVAVTGSPGTGKSTLVEDLIEGLGSSRTVIARLVSTQLRATDLLRMLAFEFKVKAEGMDKATMLRNVEAYLAIQVSAGRRVLVIVDEAQDLSTDALEELRLLTNMQLKGKPLVQVFLLGQDQLHAKITSPALEQLRQRLVAVSRLQPMTAEESHEYVYHRLSRAGWRGDPEITDAAIELVHRHSNGVPRLINQMCSRLLLHGAVEQKHKLDGNDAQIVIRELEEEVRPSHGSYLRPASEPQDPIPQSVPAPQGPRFASVRDISPVTKPVSDSAATNGGKAETVKSGSGPGMTAQTPDTQTRDQIDAQKSHQRTSAEATLAPSPSTMKPSPKMKRGRIMAVIVLMLGLVGGVLTVAALESEPLGTQLAGWSRSVANGMQGFFPANRAAPDNNGGEAEQTSTAKNVAPNNVTN